MADPLSVGAGIVGIVGVAAQISQIVFNLGLDWKEAPNTVRSFIAELQTLQKISLATSDNLLNNPEFIAAFEDRPSLTLTQYNDQSGSTAQLLDSCRSALEKLRDELQERALGRSFGWQRVKSALLAKNTQQAVQNLSRQFQTLNNMLAVDTATVSVRTLGELKSFKQEQQQFNSDEAKTTAAIQTGVDSLEQAQTQDQNRAILDWLSPLNYTATHDDLADKRAAETGGWLLASDDFEAWTTGRVKTVLGVGKPGSGKTMLTSIAIDHLRMHFSAQPEVGIAYLYFNFRRKHEQKAKDLLASLLRQLAQRASKFPSAVKQLHGRHQQFHTTPTMSNIVETLHAVLTESYSTSYFFIDALDECDVTEQHRRIFLTELFQLQEHVQLGLFATSRDIPDVIREFKGHVKFEIRAREEDVQTYLRGRMNSMPHIIQKSPELQNEITATVVAAVDGMFLLAMLHMDSLYGSRSVKAVRTKLSHLPSGSNAYDFAYDDAMQRIQSQHSESQRLAIEALSWITFASRPLHKRELCHALAVELETTDLDEDNIPELEDVISVCCGLIVLDEKSDVVRLAHYTTQEYFERTSDRWFPEAQSQIAEMCLTYLCFDEFASGPVGIGDEHIIRCQKHPLLDYAAKNWGRHCRGTQAETGLCLASFFDDPSKMDMAFQIMELGDDAPETSFMIAAQENHAVHLTAYCGLTKALAHLAETSKVDFEARNTDGKTALSYAAIKAQKQCVELIISLSGASINLRDLRGRTPFSYAAELGNTEVVQFFMTLPETEINSNDLCHRTPLSHAASNGHKEIVELLLSRPDINADTVDTEMCTPIWNAVYAGHTDVVELLLARPDVAADRLNEQGESILHSAISSSRKGVQSMVKLIIRHSPSMLHLANIHGETPLSAAVNHDDVERLKILVAQPGVTLDSRDNDGRTPLSHAAEYGTRDMVKSVLEQSPSQLNLEDYEGRSPLSWAAEEGRLGVVKFLLAQPGIDLNSEDDEGRTPVSYALERGSSSMSELFLTRKKINLNTRDNKGRTLLHYAVKDSTAFSMKLLLKRVKIDINSLDENSRTPLSFAVDNDRNSIEVVKFLVGMSTSHIDHIDKDGRTPLSYAAASAHREVVEFLLQQPGVSVDSRDEKGRTPLSYTVRNDDTRVMQLFVEHPDVDINSKDDRGQTPLSYAVEWVGIGKVKLILGRPGVDVDGADHEGRTPLSYAASSSSVIAHLLLTHGALSANSQDMSGRTPLSYAAESSSGILEYFLSLPGAQADLGDHTGRTPLSYAAEAVDVRSCKLLIAQPGTKVDACDNFGRTPFSYAASSDAAETVQLFLGLPGVNVDSVDRDGRSPLTHAIESWSTEVCALLLAHDSVQTHRTDYAGRTLLSFAAENETFVLRRLLEITPDTEVDLRDHEGRTALSYAAENDKHLSVELLVDHPGVDVNSQDNQGRTPLSYAAASYSHFSAQLLVDRPNVDVNLPDKNGKTSLAWAAESGTVSCLELLMAIPKIQIDPRDIEGRTPLSHAAVLGKIRHAELLMARSDVDVNSQDQGGASVLLRTMRERCRRIVKLLLARPDVNVNLPDHDGDTPLFFAVREGDKEFIKQLYNRYDLDYHRKDAEGRTPLQYAMENSDTEIIKLIQTQESTFDLWKEFAEEMDRLSHTKRQVS